MSTNDKSRMVQLCRKYTDMTDQEIEFLVKKSDALDELAELFDCDIFIDVPLENSTASIVVYHVYPVTNKSLYEKSPVGQPALKMNEPGVWQVSRLGGSVKGYKAFTQEDVFIRQDIHAITYDGKVLGTYIMERSFYENTGDDDDTENDYMTMTAKLNNYIDDAIYYFDTNGKLIFQNEIADNFSGNVSRENLYYNDLFGEQVPYDELLKDKSDKLIKEIGSMKSFI